MGEEKATVGSEAFQHHCLERELCQSARRKSLESRSPTETYPLITSSGREIELRLGMGMTGPLARHDDAEHEPPRPPFDTALVTSVGRPRPKTEPSGPNEAKSRASESLRRI